MKTIRVTGKGMLKIRPDLTNITLTVTGQQKDYGAALAESAEKTQNLRGALEALGFAREDLKTQFFNVDTAYENVQEHGAYRQRFAGYRCTHELKLAFAPDNDLLGRVLYALANSPAAPEFSISYAVKDPEALKNELLQKAVADAKAKAGVLADAAGVRLGELQSISYDWGNAAFELQPMNALCKATPTGADRFALDVQPDDIAADDAVTAVWEIL